MSPTNIVEAISWYCTLKKCCSSTFPKVSMSKLRNSNLFAARACRVLFEKRRKRNSIEFWFSDCQSHPEYQDDDHVTVWQQLANIRPCMRNIFWPSSWRSFWRGSRWTPRRAGSGCCWRTRRPPWSAASSGAQSRWTSSWRSGEEQFLFFLLLHLGD